MKQSKSWVRLGVILAFVALAVGLWLFAYHNRKSLDNIPSLELVIREGEAFGHEKTHGYKREMLKEIWGEPVESSEHQDIWTIGPGSAMVRVNYNWQDEAVTLGVIPAVSDKEYDNKWNCSVTCAEESKENAYVITYSDEKVVSDTGQITFQNRNDFVITVHLSGEGKEVFVSEIQAGGNVIYKQAEKEVSYTVGIHADVEEGTELKLMVYDGEWSETY